MYRLILSALLALSLAVLVEPPGGAAQGREKNGKAADDDDDGADENPVAGNFPRTFAAVAVPEGQLPKLVEGHPRLLIRAKPWKGGLSLDQLKTRLSTEPWAGTVKGLKKPDGNTYDKDPEQAAEYYLFTRDDSVIPELVQAVLNGHYATKCGGHLMRYALIYDWIYNNPKVTDEQKKKMGDKLVELANESLKHQEGNGDIMHHYGSGGWGADVLIAGLALAGDHPEGKKLLSLGLGHYRAAYMPMWRLTEGGWLGGGQSYAAALRTVPQAMACLDSALEDGIADQIAKEQGNWLERNMYFMMYMLFPDKTRSDLMGFERGAYKLCHMDSCMMMIARMYKSPDCYAWLRWLKYEPKNDPLLYDEETDAKKPLFPDKLPTAQLWGRDTLGYLQIREKGWSPDATIIELKCGDYIWSHTANTANNSFFIYHKGRLAILTGTYDSYFKNDHCELYYANSVSTNTMLIVDPTEFRKATRPGQVPGTDADGYYVTYGGQRLNMGSLNVMTAQEYLARKEAFPSSKKSKIFNGWEMGSIPAYEAAADGSYTYICGDATQAYNNPQRCYATNDRKCNPKTDLCTRSMAWVAHKYLVVFDRVNSLDASFRKAWLLHTIDKPEISGKVIKAEVPEHIEDFDGDSVQITWGKGEIPIPTPGDPGRLLLKTFLPEKHYIRRVGGEGYEFWVNGVNPLPTRDWPRASQIKKGKDFFRETGSWRIELSPSEPKKFDNFLTLLYPCDTKTDKMPESRMIGESKGKMVGVAVDGWVVMFGKEKAGVEGDIAYEVGGEPIEHLVVDLQKNKPYSVEAGGKKEKLTASAEGVLRFQGAGQVKITPE